MPVPAEILLTSQDACGAGWAPADRASARSPTQESPNAATA